MTEHNRTEAARRLLDVIEYWCHATNTREGALGHVLFLHPGFVGLLRKRLTVTPEKESLVRQFIAEHPNGYHGALPKTHANETQPVGRASSPAIRRREIEELRAAEQGRLAQPRVHRDPCQRCGARGDVDCGHSRQRLGTSL